MTDDVTITITANEDGNARISHEGTDDLRLVSFYLGMAWFQFMGSITGIPLAVYEDEGGEEPVNDNGRHAR